ncbi:addiction module antidote protein [Candidatus Electrothrix sp.]|uniref:addiction module antidote protein n=1 Tax=Candidatus Electrothrix sp. TaxID=2170559 RepID=UPI004056B431
MKKNTASYKQGLHEDLADPVEAAEYLNAALEDGSQEMFLMALKDIADAKGISEIARSANLNRENLYKNFSTKGNPNLKSLTSILHSIGLRLTVDVESAVKC